MCGPEEDLILALMTLGTQNDGQAPSTTRRPSAMRHLVLPLAGTASVVAALALTALPTGTAHAAGGLYYQYGLTVQGSWLCRGWSDGSYHCTQHWYRDSAGNLVSTNQAWVPTGGAVAQSSTAPATTAPASAPQNTTTSASSGTGVGMAPEPCSANVPSSVWTSVAYWQPGAVPPGCYSGVYAINPANYVYRPYFGVCNWWPEVLRPDEPGIPYDLSYPRVSTPRVGATIVYAPGVDGAGSTGHYGHVESVSPDGRWVLTSEMNFYWRGGGWGKVVYRYVPIGAGVSFIY